MVKLALMQMMTRALIAFTANANAALKTASFAYWSVAVWNIKPREKLHLQLLCTE